ncbi:DUF4259 domain-containing protein [uncultured Tateyamaria sp.]|uniref:DUF4259 domain-containing protein n=1 Tax=uncultured Tateyamaria sp. TaxID=455651 RepID=UPI002624553C|nr:DUF4259 domain-containing protein [uncultured Tateyamaria sp.]
MGAFGVGIFEDDTSLDWIEEEYASGGVEAVRAALDEAADTSAADYLEVDAGSAARAAAEAVAASFDAGPAIDEDDLERLREHEEDIAQDDGLIALALRAVRRITAENSELAELWTEEEASAAVWTAEMDGLETRLRGLL